MSAFNNNKRYVTRGVQEQVPFKLQVFCWCLIGKEVKSGTEMDYLQIFEFQPDTDDKQNLKVIHRQEQPPFRNEYKLLDQKFSVSKLWVIDDETHQTMLLPEEY